MVAKERLKDLLASKEFSRRDKVLICLATESASPKSVSEIKAIAAAAGLHAAKKWNISDLLSKASGLAVRTDLGWELVADGRIHVSDLVGPDASSPVVKTAASLRKHLASITDSEVKQFLEEAIECFERSLYRAAIVFTWVGAISLLQAHVVAHNLAAFNKEAARRDAKWKTAKTTDDLSRMKEYDFLQVLEAISVVGKNVKQELEKQLKLRNACGHPNSLKVAELTASAHIEVLLLNVYDRFQ